jgi:hypothetical protein
MQDCVFEPGATLVTQGEPADDIIIIQSGHVYVIADPEWKEGAKPSTDMAQCMQVHHSRGQAMLIMRMNAYYLVFVCQCRCVSNLWNHGVNPSFVPCSW